MRVAQVLKPDGSNGVIWVDLPVFGTQYDYVEDNTVSSTSSSTFQLKLTETTAVIPAGDYRVTVHSEISNSTNNGEVEVEVQVDSTPRDTLAHEVSNGNQYLPFNDFFVETFTNAAHTIEVFFRKPSGGGNALIRNVRIELFRVS